MRDALRFLLKHPEGPFPDDLKEEIVELCTRQERPTNVIDEETIKRLAEAQKDGKESCLDTAATMYCVVPE